MLDRKEEHYAFVEICCQMYSYRFAVQHSSKFPPAWLHFLTRMTRELETLRSTAALLMLLAELRVCWSSSSVVFTFCAYTIDFM